MNIEEFLYILENSIKKITKPYEKKYPKNVDFNMKYKSLKYIQKSKIYNDETQKKYMLYQKKDSNKLYCLGIDQELEYINKLDYDLKLPIKNRSHLFDAVLEAIELYDNLNHIYNVSNLSIEYNSKVNINLIYKLLIDGDNIDDFEKYLLLVPFDNNPIRKDIYLAQFKFFIKKYLEFRLNYIDGNRTHVSKNDFNSALRFALHTYTNSTEKSVFYQIIIEGFVTNK